MFSGLAALFFLSVRHADIFSLMSSDTLYAALRASIVFSFNCVVRSCIVCLASLSASVLLPMSFGWVSSASISSACSTVPLSSDADFSASEKSMFEVFVLNRDGALLMLAVFRFLRALFLLRLTRL